MPTALPYRRRDEKLCIPTGLSVNVSCSTFVLLGVARSAKTTAHQYLLGSHSLVWIECT